MRKPAASCDARAGDLADDFDGGLAHPNLGARQTRANRCVINMPHRNPAWNSRLSARQSGETQRAIVVFC